ncbi:hypothetical protein QFZ83_006294 [Variovorax sp. W1I1]|nr:hypothetical protein [Variovorax sp. W1I1]
MSVPATLCQCDEVHTAAAARPMSDGVGPLSAETGLDLAPQRLLRPQPALAAFLAAIAVPDGWRCAVVLILSNRQQPMSLTCCLRNLIAQRTMGSKRPTQAGSVRHMRGNHDDSSRKLKMKFKNYAAIVALFLLARPALSTEIPEASGKFRAQLIKENTASCVAGIEVKPELRALFTRKTIEAFCTCRQRYRADVISQAAKMDKRGKAVEDEAHEYAQAKCSHILTQQLEHE